MTYTRKGITPNNPVNAAIIAQLALYSDKTPRPVDPFLGKGQETIKTE